MKKEIIYLHMARANPPVREDGKWKIEELDITLPPTLCKVTINKTIVISDVYVWCKPDENICLYKRYHIERWGWCFPDKENCSAVFRGDGLLLEFKSDDFVIEAME